MMTLHRYSLELGSVPELAWWVPHLVRGLQTMSWISHNLVPGRHSTGRPKRVLEALERPVHPVVLANHRPNLSP